MGATGVTFQSPRHLGRSKCEISRDLDRIKCDMSQDICKASLLDNDMAPPMHCIAGAEGAINCLDYFSLFHSQP